MKLKYITLLILFLFYPVLLSGAKANLKGLLRDLDKNILLIREYDQLKEQGIEDLKKQLKESKTNEESHNIYSRLYREYEAYIYDSALYYVQEHLNLALKDENASRINECKINLARMYSTFARFPEAIDLLNSIDRTILTDDQLGGYYNSYAEVYTYWSEYNSNDDVLKYVSLRDTYQDSALMVIPKHTYAYDINSGKRFLELGLFEDSKKNLLPYLDTIEPYTRDYAILTSIIAYMYGLMKEENLQKEYLAVSAISDLKASVKENTSMRILAHLLLNDGEIERANLYIKKSLEDANFYNARLRNIQIAQILPVIDKAYQLEKEKYQRNLQIGIVLIVILSLVLVFIVFYLYKQMKKLARARKDVLYANNQLKKMNIHLSETNQIKEEYIGRFMNQCSIYIDKLESYRKQLNKKAAAGNMDDLYATLKSNQIIEDELKDFYQNFDSTFLKLFPDFVKQFNDLLPDEDKIVIKQENCLTIELRIFALIRLGITDSARIASFLRYSITTIYNYRSKYRNKSIIPRDKFEEEVMKLGS